MSVENLLNSESSLTLLGAMLGAAWTVFRSSEWCARLRRRRFQAAIQALEAAVEETYRTYVQALKESRADGRLTPEECRRARERARERAIEIARARGLNLLRELGPEYLDLWIARLVKKLKNA